MKKLLSGILVAAGLLAGSAGVAHADGTLSSGEELVGDQMSGAICEFIDDQGVNTSSMMDLFTVVYQQRAVHTPDDAADVINYVVYVYCHDHWKELVAFGEGARS
jgi:hypothetical protein